MKIASITKICAATALAVTMAGCSSWDSMSHRQKAPWAAPRWAAWPAR